MGLKYSNWGFAVGKAYVHHGSGRKEKKRGNRNFLRLKP